MMKELLENLSKVDQNLEIASSIASMFCEYEENEDNKWVILGVVNNLASAQECLVRIFELYAEMRGGVTA